MSSAVAAPSPQVGPTPPPALLEDAPRLAFRPDIEGLRAVAVVLVVLLHAGVGAVSGGYVGVDVFFVISGFLITSLLVDEVRETRRVSILGFYARRARRILPAACIVIAVTVVVAYWQLGDLVGAATAVDGRWAALFAANFRFIQQGTDYFASALPPSSLQNFWSLAVEEQFYLVWPTLVWAFAYVGRRFARPTLAVRLGLGAIVVGSLLWSVHLTTLDPTRAYFSPFTRAWELGIGGLIAVLTVPIARLPRSVRAATTWLGLALVLVAAFTFSAETAFPGYTALLPVLGTAFVIAGGVGAPRGTTGTLLGLGPVRWVGKISYSLYLWHWPVLVIAEERAGGSLSDADRVLCVALTLALSIASYYGIEQSLRSGALLRAPRARGAWERSRKALLVGAVAIAVAFGASTVVLDRSTDAIAAAAEVRTQRGTIADGMSPSLDLPGQISWMQAKVARLVSEGVGLRHVPPDVDPPVLAINTALVPKYTACLQPQDDVSVRPCTFGDTGSDATIAVIGDSKAMQWMPGIDAYAKRVGYRVVTMYKTACSVPTVDQFTTFSRFVPYKECATWRADAFRHLRTLHPEAVILAYSEENTKARGPADLALWDAGLRTSLREIQEVGAPVLQLAANPTLRQDPGVCLSRRGANPQDCMGDVQRRERIEVERAVIRDVGATYIETEPWLCDEGKCPPIIDHRIAYFDHSHLSSQYILHITPLLAARFRQAGLR